MILLRSLLFNLLFYLNLVLHLLIALPTLAMTPRAVVGVAKMWGRTNLWLLRHVCDLRVEWRGLEKIPPGGLIVAAKHQSAWETFALLTILADPVFILKRELMWIPMFGWCLYRGGMIPVDRGAGRSALIAMTKRARTAIAEGHQIIIFPEGTRRPAGAPPKYKFGVAFLYADCDAPCVPIALNSGLFWPRRRFLRFPGNGRGRGPRPHHAGAATAMRSSPSSRRSSKPPPRASSMKGCAASARPAARISRRHGTGTERRGEVISFPVGAQGWRSDIGGPCWARSPRGCGIPISITAC